MKFTILGFSQKASIELGLSLKDLLILRWFVDYHNSGRMISKKINGEDYYWVDYRGIIKSLPILNTHKTDTIYRSLKNMSKIGILDHETIKQGGVWSYYKIGKNYIKLIDDDYENDFNIGNKSEGIRNKSEGIGNESEGIGNESRTKNKSINNKSINNKSINNIYSLVIDKLNTLAETSYRSSSLKTQKLIRARQNEGYELEDFYKVIENKVMDWKGTEWAKYLRPETLFSNKFENYLNEKIVKGGNRDARNGSSFEQHAKFLAERESKENITDDELARLERELEGF